MSVDGTTWDEVAKKERFRPPATGPDDSGRKPRDVTGPETFEFEQKSVRYVKVEATRLRKTRYFDKYAMQLSEIEVVLAGTTP